MNDALLTPLPILDDADVGADGHGVLVYVQGKKQLAVRRTAGKWIPARLIKSPGVLAFLSEHQYENVRRLVFEAWYWFRSAPPMKGALEGVARIHAAYETVGQKKKIRVVSSSDPKAYVNLCRWCDRKMGLGRSDVQLVSPGRYGNKIALAEGLAFFLENDLEKLLQLRKIEEARRPRLRLLKTPYTKDLLLPDDVKLVTWEQFADEVVEWILNTYR